MALIAPAWTKPCCWQMAGQGTIAISTAPGATERRVAPRVAMNCCFSKLEVTRATGSMRFP